MIECTGCGQQVGLLAQFPGDLCLACYRVSPEGTRPVSASELAAMWGVRR